MGCGVSRFEEAPRGRIKRRRHPTPSLKEANPSKKQRRHHHSNEDVGEFITHFNPLFEGNVQRDETDEKVKGPNANAEFGEKQNGTEDKRRMGNKEDVFPASPSFRIYYLENVDDDMSEVGNENQKFEESTCHIQNDAQGEEAVPLKDSDTMTEKKGWKRRGFEKAMKGKVRLRTYVLQEFRSGDSS